MTDENLRKIAKRAFRDILPQNNNRREKAKTNSKVSKKKLEHLDNLSPRKDDVPIHSPISVSEPVADCRTTSIELLTDRLQSNSIRYQPLTSDFPVKKFDHTVVNTLCDEHNRNTSSYDFSVREGSFQRNCTISSIKSNNTQSVRGPMKKQIHSSFETITSGSSRDESVSPLSVTPNPETIPSFSITPSSQSGESVLLRNGKLDSEVLGSWFFKRYGSGGQQQSLIVNTNNVKKNAITHSSHLQMLQGYVDELPLYSFQDILDLPPNIRFIDTHCNLEILFKQACHNGNFKNYRAMLKHTFPASYEGCMTVFSNPLTFSQVPLWKQVIEEEGIWGIFGCHPSNSKDYDDSAHLALFRALDHHKVKALGAVGLDYSKRNNCPRVIQCKVFEEQLKLAVRKNKPLVIHNTEAFSDCLAIMKRFVPHDYKIHLHGFMDSWYIAKAWMDVFPNLFIGLTNAVTFPSARKVHNVGWNIPLNRLLLESDAPNHLPEMMPRKLQWSHPGMAVHVAAQVAALKNIDLEETLNTVRSNTYNMYGI